MGVFVLAALALAPRPGPCAAIESGPAVSADYCVLPEPSFMRHPVSQPIPYAKQTVLVPARFGPADPEPVILDRASFERLGFAWSDLLRAARRRASHHLQTLAPTYERDRHRVIECVVFRSPNPLTASILLAPEFPRLLEGALGPSPRVLVPNRNTVYAFPALAGRLDRYAEGIAIEFKDAAYPVSLEVFELGQNGLRAVGALAR